MSTSAVAEPPKPEATTEAPDLKNHPVVSRQEWTEARKKFLEREKEVMQMQDELAAERRLLPWVRVDKEYIFDTPKGKQTLADLFEGRSQLVIYHFMLGPDWDEGCTGCSFMADHIDGPRQHLIHHDVAVTVISRAPLQKIEAYKARMGWKFPWASAFETDFNQDYHVSASEADKARGRMVYNFEDSELEIDELPGVSVFYKDDSGTIYHTYSSYSRGPEALLGTYSFLDLTPKGRNENGPNFNLGDWVKRHDEYEAAPASECCGCSK